MIDDESFERLILELKVRNVLLLYFDRKYYHESMRETIDECVNITNQIRWRLSE